MRLGLILLLTSCAASADTPLPFEQRKLAMIDAYEIATRKKD